MLENFLQLRRRIFDKIFALDLNFFNFGSRTFRRPEPADQRIPKQIPDDLRFAVDPLENRFKAAKKSECSPKLYSHWEIWEFKENSKDFRRFEASLRWFWGSEIPWDSKYFSTFNASSICLKISGKTDREAWKNKKNCKIDKKFLSRAWKNDKNEPE